MTKLQEIQKRRQDEYAIDLMTLSTVNRDSLYQLMANAQIKADIDYLLQLLKRCKPWLEAIQDDHDVECEIENVVTEIISMTECTCTTKELKAVIKELEGLE